MLRPRDLRGCISSVCRASFLQLLVIVLLLQFIRLRYLVDFANVLRHSDWQLAFQLLHHLSVAFLADFVRGHSFDITHLVLRLHPVVVILLLHDRSKSLRLVCIANGVWLNVEGVEAIISIKGSKLTFLVDHGWGIAHWPQLDL